MSRDRDAIVDILEAARLILEYTAERNYEDYASDQRTKDAVLRRFEIIGEAAKRVSSDLRSQCPNVRWREMANMRNRVIHGYDTVDQKIVWLTIQQDLPFLCEQMEAILADVEDD